MSRMTTAKRHDEIYHGDHWYPKKSPEMTKTDLAAISEQGIGTPRQLAGDDTFRHDKSVSMRKIKSLGLLKTRQRAQSIDVTHDELPDLPSVDYAEDAKRSIEGSPIIGRGRMSTTSSSRRPSHPPDWQPNDYFGKEWAGKRDSMSKRSRVTTKESQNRLSHSRDPSEVSYASGNASFSTPVSSDLSSSLPSARTLTTGSVPPLPHDAVSKWKKHVRAMTPSSLKISKLLTHKKTDSRSSTLNSSPTDFGEHHHILSIESEIQGLASKQRGYSASPIVSTESNTSSDNERDTRSKGRGRRKKRDSIFVERSRTDLHVTTSERKSSLNIPVLEKEKNIRQGYWNEGVTAAPRVNSLGLYSPPSTARATRDFVPLRASMGLPVPQRRARRKPVQRHSLIQSGSTDTVGPEPDDIRELRSVLVQTLGHGQSAKSRRNTRIRGHESTQSAYASIDSHFSTSDGANNYSFEESRAREVRTLLDDLRTEALETLDKASLETSRSAHDLITRLINFVADDVLLNQRRSRSRFPSCDDMLCDIAADATICRQVNYSHGGSSSTSTNLSTSPSDFREAVGTLCLQLSKLQA